MKLKRVSFTSTSWDKPRNISALGGNQNAIYVGQIANHTARAESAKVASLDYDGRTSQLYMRLVYNGGPNDGKPFRRMTVNPAMQEGEECDVLGMFCDDRTLFYYDDEVPQTWSAGDAAKAGQTVIVPPLGEFAKVDPSTLGLPTVGPEPKVLNPEVVPSLAQDPPRAQPIQKQNNQGQPRR